MDPAIQEMATNLLLDLQHENREPKNVEIEENCRLGLGKKFNIQNNFLNFIRVLIYFISLNS